MLFSCQPVPLSLGLYLRRQLPIKHSNQRHPSKRCMPRNWLECTKFADKSFILAGDTGQTEARVALHPVRTTLCIYRRQLFQRMHSPSQKHTAGDPGFNEFIPKQSCMYWLTTGLVLKLKFIYRAQGYPGPVNVALTYSFYFYDMFLSSASKNKNLNPLYSDVQIIAQKAVFAQACSTEVDTKKRWKLSETSSQ